MNPAATISVTRQSIKDKVSTHPVSDGVPPHPIFLERDPRKIREIIRRGKWTGATKTIAPGYAQASLVVLPKSEAYDFLVFCLRNPKPCAVMEVTEMGDPEPRMCAPGADLRTDLPSYRVFRYGELVDEVTDITSHWRDDFIAFLLPCGITFDGTLLLYDVPIRQIEEKRGPTMFRSNIPCLPAGKFKGNMVVSLRPMPPEKAIRAVQVTSRFPSTHGAPIHIGDPAGIGIKDVNQPDWGVSVTIHPGEIPVFWACGATPQVVVQEAKVEIMISHKPGHQFITDRKAEFFAVM